MSPATNPQSIAGLTGNTGYEYFVRANCGDGDFSEWVGPFNFFTGHCLPNATNTVTATFIDNFITSGAQVDVNNSGTGRSGVYSDFYATNTITTYVGQSFDITVNEVSGTVGIAIWVDWNDNLIFETSEVLANTTSYESDFSQTVTIPSGISNGHYRLRVMIDWSDSNPDDNACELIRGEVEDYKITITDQPACLTPIALNASSVAGTSAYLEWTSGGSGESSWDIEYGTTGFSQGTGTTISPATNLINVTGLIPETTYDYYVRANCGGGDFSTWAGPFSFTTTCVAFNIPFTENFDSSTTGSSTDTNAPNCWSFIDSGSGYVYVYDNSATNVQSGAKSYRLYNGFDLSGDYMLISPVIAELTTDGVQVELSVKGSSGQELELGTITDPSDAATFTVISTVSLTSSSYEDILVNIPTSTDSYFAVRHGQTGTYDNYYLDDFSFAALPSCVEPNALNATGITATAADLSWTTGGSGETSWEVEYGLDGFTQGSGTVVSPASNPQNITGLSATTDYDYYVRANCGGSDFSEWVGPYSFTTLCPAETPDYVESFDTYLPSCWEEATGEIDGVLSGTTSSWASDGFGNNGSTGAAKYNMYTTTLGQWLISPTIDLGTGNNYQLEFDIAITNWDETTAASFETDDYVALVISTDNGATWTSANVLQTWEQGTEASPTGDDISIDLSPYSGSVKFGYLAKASSSNSSDFDLFIDNFTVNSSSTEYTWNGAAWSTTPEGNITANDNMIVQVGMMPSLTSAINVGNLIVEAGASIEADNGDIIVAGNLENNGSITGTNQVILSGATASVTGTGSMTYLTVAATGDVTIIGVQSIIEQLDVISGGQLDASGNITMVSNAMGTARIDEFDAGAIIGDVNIERYIPAGNRSFRFVGTSVTGSSVFNSWQEAGANNTGFGTHVTGTVGTAGTVNSTTGLDETATGNQSMFKWSDSSQEWIGITDTRNEILNAGEFYRLFVRGDRGASLTTSSPNNAATTLRSSGSLYQSAFTLNPSVTNGQFFALANPYQSKISLNGAVTGTTSDLYYWDPTAFPNGTYSTIAINGTPTAGTSGNATNVLEPGQAVFFIASGGSPSVSISQSNKVIGTNNTGIFNVNPLQQRVRLKIYHTSRYVNNLSESDGLYIDFNNAHNLSLDDSDALKLNGSNVNMAISKSTGELLSVERRTLPTTTESIQLNMSNYLTTNYTIVATIDNLPGITAYLKDNYNGRLTELISGTETPVSFTVDANDALSVDASRFEIVFEVVTLSNDDMLFESQISLYPNPVKDDVLNISLGTVVEGNVNVSLFNMLGQEVISKSYDNISRGIISLDNLSVLESGLYIVHLNDGVHSVMRKIVLD